LCLFYVSEEPYGCYQTVKTFPLGVPDCGFIVSCLHYSGPFGLFLTYCVQLDIGVRCHDDC
jgi:hypothetical protein